MVGIVSAVFNVAVCIGVPLGAFLVLLRRRSGWRVFLLGMAGFFVSQLCVRQPLLALLGQVDAYRLFAAGNPVGQLLFLSLTAGLAEESARLVIFRLLARKGRVQHSTPVWYGLGHGGLEAALVGVNSLVLLVIFPELLQRAGWTVALAGVERISAQMVQVALSFFVFCGLRRKRWFVAAILLHTLCNFMTVVTLFGVSDLMLEVLLFAFAAVVLYAAIKLWKGEDFHEKNLA